MNSIENKEQNVSGNNIPRRRSYVPPIALLAYFIASLIITKIIYVKKPEARDDIRLIIVCLVIAIILTIVYIGKVKRLNAKLKNNEFKYGFDYHYEFEVYKCIGKFKQKKYCGKNIHKCEKYSDWRKYIEEKYVNDKECFVQRDFDNFYRFLNKKRRTVRQSQDLITGLVVPLEVLLLTFFLEKFDGSLLAAFLFLLSSAIVVVAICMKMRFGDCAEDDFITDLFEIFNQKRDVLYEARNNK